jgi:hypothetical protein
MEQKQSKNQTNTSSSAFPPFDNRLSPDEQVVQSFVNIIQSKLDSKELSSSTLYEKEKNMLKKCVLYPGVLIGSVVGVVSFITLRRAPLYIVHSLQRRHYAVSTNHTSTNASTNSSTNARTTHTNHNNTTSTQSSKLQLFQEGPILTLVGGIMDLMVASMMGTVAWMISINKQHTLQTCASLPLKSGTSQITNVLCPQFVSLYRTIDESFWRTYTDDSVQSIRQFCINCDIRKRYERRIMMEMGFSKRDIDKGIVQVELQNDIDASQQYQQYQQQYRDIVVSPTTGGSDDWSVQDYDNDNDDDIDMEDDDDAGF